jgi:hypothetical protein
MKTRPLSVVALAIAVSLLTGTFVSAQDSDWVVPDDYEPPTSTPSVPPSPLAPVGPVLFDEAEFPFTGSVDGFVTNTLAGAPLDGPLSFAAPAGATFNTGPGSITLFEPPGIVGQTGGTLTIDFGVDVTDVSFNFALQCGIVSNGDITVSAFDSGAGLVGMTTVPGLDFGDFFIQNQVAFSPGTFRSIEIAFSGANCNAYGVDFLAWDTVAVAPAMGPLWLVALAALLLAVGARFTRRRENA